MGYQHLPFRRATNNTLEKTGASGANTTPEIEILDPREFLGVLYVGVVKFGKPSFQCFEKYTNCLAYSLSTTDRKTFMSRFEKTPKSNLLGTLKRLLVPVTAKAVQPKPDPHDKRRHVELPAAGSEELTEVRQKEHDLLYGPEFKSTGPKEATEPGSQPKLRPIDFGRWKGMVAAGFRKAAVDAKARLTACTRHAHLRALEDELAKLGWVCRVDLTTEKQFSKYQVVKMSPHRASFTLAQERRLRHLAGLRSVLPRPTKVRGPSLKDSAIAAAFLKPRESYEGRIADQKKAKQHEMEALASCVESNIKDIQTQAYIAPRRKEPGYRAAPRRATRRRAEERRNKSDFGTGSANAMSLEDSFMLTVPLLHELDLPPAAGADFAELNGRAAWWNRLMGSDVNWIQSTYAMRAVNQIHWAIVNMVMRFVLSLFTMFSSAAMDEHELGRCEFIAGALVGAPISEEIIKRIAALPILLTLGLSSYHAKFLAGLYYGFLEMMLYLHHSGTLRRLCGVTPVTETASFSRDAGFLLLRSAIAVLHAVLTTMSFEEAIVLHFLNNLISLLLMAQDPAIPPTTAMSGKSRNRRGKSYAEAARGKDRDRKRRERGNPRREQNVQAIAAEAVRVAGVGGAEHAIAVAEAAADIARGGPGPADNQQEGEQPKKKPDPRPGYFSETDDGQGISYCFATVRGEIDKPLPNSLFHYPGIWGVDLWDDTNFVPRGLNKLPCFLEHERGKFGPRFRLTYRNAKTKLGRLIWILKCTFIVLMSLLAPFASNWHLTGCSLACAAAAYIMWFWREDDGSILLETPHDTVPGTSLSAAALANAWAGFDLYQVLVTSVPSNARPGRDDRDPENWPIPITTESDLCRVEVIHLDVRPEDGTFLRRHLAVSNVDYTLAQRAVQSVTSGDVKQALKIATAAYCRFPSTERLLQNSMDQYDAQWLIRAMLQSHVSYNMMLYPHLNYSGAWSSFQAVSTPYQ